MITQEPSLTQSWGVELEEARSKLLRLQQKIERLTAAKHRLEAQEASFARDISTVADPNTLYRTESLAELIIKVGSLRQAMLVIDDVLQQEQRYLALAQRSVDNIERDFKSVADTESLSGKD